MNKAVKYFMIILIVLVLASMACVGGGGGGSGNNSGTTNNLSVSSPDATAATGAQQLQIQLTAIANQSQK